VRVRQFRDRIALLERGAGIGSARTRPKPASPYRLEARRRPIRAQLPL